MHTLCHDVQKFVSACEGIQAVLAQGGVLTPDERAVIEESAIQLLRNMKAEERDEQHTNRSSSFLPLNAGRPA